MPAFQRDFVWRADQIEALFDSLYFEYPIHSFIFWQVEPKTLEGHGWYDFLRDYDERVGGSSAAIQRDVSGNGLVAVVDGQQRLTSLNIGLRGTHTTRRRNARKIDPRSYITRSLYFDLAFPDHRDVASKSYAFRFLSEDEVERAGEQWRLIPLSKVYEIEDESAFVDSVTAEGVSKDSSAENNDATDARLKKLWRMVNAETRVAFHLVKDQDYDTLVDMFIRTNDFGKPLKKADIIMSLASSHWRKLDAKTDVKELISEVNQVGNGFGFDSEFVLKACLVLADEGGVQFKADNFKRDVALAIESQWTDITYALTVAAHLMHAFNLSGSNLTSRNALLPVAYYLYRFRLTEGMDFLELVRFRTERDQIRRWVLQNLLGSVWSSSTDSRLTRLRRVISENGGDGFPVRELEEELTHMDILFDDSKLASILSLKKGHAARNALNLMFPSVADAYREYHMDHIFPRALLTGRSKRAPDFDEYTFAKFREYADLLPNLMLLPGTENKSKQDKLPLEWLQERYDDPRMLIDAQDLGDLPEGLEGFVDWFDSRHSSMMELLRQKIGTSS